MKQSNNDFLPGLYDSFQIFYKINKNDKYKWYMNIGFDTEARAMQEIKLMKETNKYKNAYDIQVVCKKVRRLKIPGTIV